MKGHTFSKQLVGYRESGLRGYSHPKHVVVFKPKQKTFKENFEQIAEKVEKNPAIRIIIWITAIVLSVLLGSVLSAY